MLRILFLAMLALPNIAAACGPDTNCEIGDRYYRIAMPEGHDGVTPVGAIVFAHGYRGSARGAMNNANLRRMVSDMGLALIAVKSAGPDWDIPGVPDKMDSTGVAEMAYFDAVISDATTRFAVDPARLMMSGFSAGGMVTWELACNRPDLFAGFAPVAGTFWQKPPEDCAGPANVVHIHGTEDRTVPLAGRRIADTKQGDVMEVLDMYRGFGGYTGAELASTDRLSCMRSANGAGQVLEFCTFEGGHSFSRTFLSYAWERLEDAGAV